MKQKNTTERIHLSEKEVSQNEMISDSLKKSLDTEVNDMDWISSSKLYSSRQRALEQLQTKKQSFFTGFSRIGFALAASIIIAVTLFIEAPQQVSEIDTTAEAQVFENLNVLASNDSVEFFQSLDFLIWLENESDTQG
ncbi:MAG: hypothetical protein GY806_13460 [Gammaproteobacteria bacterium]|nr:hypothetical protein [Gammaproteobacteria bacterium]